jgi:DNA polymerase II small subunit
MESKGKYENEEFKRVLDFELDECQDRDSEKDYEVRGDISGRSYGSGEIDTYVKLFRDRYKRLSEHLKDKLQGVHPAKLLDASMGGQEIAVVGLVKETRDTQNNNKFIKFEDTTGEGMVVFSDEEMFDKCDEVVNDEVIGIKGTLSDNGDIIFGDELHFPNTPLHRDLNFSDREVKAALISDIHFGSQEFAADKWQDFTNFVRRNGDIEYVVIAGDLVEGVGVYPEQKEELLVTSVEEQYELCAKAFDKLPDDVQIIASMGNHDTPRLAEPQPKLREEYAEKFSDNVELVGNPVLLDLEGVKIQIYHGMSIKPISDSIPGLEMTTPEEPMEHLLKKRHLNPVYGEERIAPEEKDYLIIDEVPDILHSGHVHKLGFKKYRTTKIINSGCWQKRTAFQEKMNVNPEVGTAPIVDLSTQDIEIRKF